MTQADINGREKAIQTAADWFDAGHCQQLLADRIASPTASEESTPEQLAFYLSKSMGPYLEDLGFRCEVFANPVKGMPPMLIGTRMEGKDLPTVLTYGHGDVVRGQDAQWREGLGPWRLCVEGDRWYGRGTADNKGQHTINLAALAHVIKARNGSLGYNVTLLLEMGEEVGSPGLRELCQQEKQKLQADVFVASDGPRVHAERPTVFLGSRGIVNFTLRLRSRDRAFHSGNWGGVLTNPAVVIAHAVGCLVGPRGAILVEKLQPPEMNEEVRTALQSVTVGTGDDDPEMDANWGRADLSAAERLHGWNTLEVLALGAGSADRPVGAIPSQAVAHCQLRFVPGTRWESLETSVREHLDAHGFTDVDVVVTAATPATRLSLQNPWVNWTLDSITRSTGKTPTLLPNLAGSLPNDAFADILGQPTLWVPHSYPACAQHAPNEHLLASVAREGLLLMTGLFWDLGQSPTTPWYATGNSPIHHAKEDHDPQPVTP